MASVVSMASMACGTDLQTLATTDHSALNRKTKATERKEVEEVETAEAVEATVAIDPLCTRYTSFPSSALKLVVRKHGSLAAVSVDNIRWGASRCD